jgi:hypothetical protein
MRHPDAEEDLDEGRRVSIALVAAITVLTRGYFYSSLYQQQNKNLIPAPETGSRKEILRPTKIAVIGEEKYALKRTAP